MDKLIKQLAKYVIEESAFTESAFETAKWALIDSLGCAIKSLEFPACRRLLGPLYEQIIPNGVPIPGTKFILDPLTAAFNLGTMIRYLDYNDTWLAAEWGHPSDQLGAYLALCFQKQYPLKRLLTAAIKGYEIQGILALNTSYNQIGFDHVILVKVACAAVSTWLLGGSQKQIEEALSQAFIDNGPLRTYRHFPNTGSRKSWAASDAASRGLQLAYWTMRGEEGYATALTAPQWGVQDVLFKGQPLILAQPLASYVMENILFKVKFPAEFHAQTAVEAAISLHPQLSIEQIKHIVIETQKPAMRIIDKKGPLRNAADRDHCLQYAVAVALLKGHLTAQDYEEANEQADALREKMEVVENPAFTKGYYDLERRSIANSITIERIDGTTLGPVIVEYPLGHPKRREESLPFLREKFIQNTQHSEWLSLFEEMEMPVDVLFKEFSNHG